jgi:hypothetical protein
MPDALAARVWDLPGWAFSTILGQPIWKWVSALSAVAVTIGFLWLAWRAGGAWDRRASAGVGGWLVGRERLVSPPLLIGPRCRS